MLVGALAGTARRRRADRRLAGRAVRAVGDRCCRCSRCRRSPGSARRRRERRRAGGEPQGSALRLLAEVLRRDGARQVLIAQVLWVALVRRADAVHGALRRGRARAARRRRGRRCSPASACSPALGMLRGARHAGRPAPRATLLTGVALLGGGLLAATAASSLAQAAVPFAAAALGAGLVSAVGFPYFTRFVPERPGRPLRRRVLLRPRDRHDRRAAGRRAADRGHRLLPRAARHGRARARRARAAGARRAPPRRVAVRRCARRSGGSPRSSRCTAPTASTRSPPRRCATSTTSCSSTTARRPTSRRVLDARRPRPARAGRAHGRQPRQGHGGRGRHRGGARTRDPTR